MLFKLLDNRSPPVGLLMQDHNLKIESSQKCRNSLFHFLGVTMHQKNLATDFLIVLSFPASDKAISSIENSFVWRHKDWLLFFPSTLHRYATSPDEIIPRMTALHHPIDSLTTADRRDPQLLFISAISSEDAEFFNQIET